MVFDTLQKLVVRIKNIHFSLQKIVKKMYFCIVKTEVRCNGNLL